MVVFAYIWLTANLSQKNTKIPKQKFRYSTLLSRETYPSDCLLVIFSVFCFLCPLLGLGYWLLSLNSFSIQNLLKWKLLIITVTNNCKYICLIKLWNRHRFLPDGFNISREYSSGAVLYCSVNLLSKENLQSQKPRPNYFAHHIAIKQNKTSGPSDRPRLDPAAIKH